jgi:type I restriction enzyme S subunit
MKTKTNKTALIPKLRFPEFKDSGAWEVKRLGEVLSESKIPSEENDPTKRITVRLNLNGVEKREYKGTEAKSATHFYKRKAGQFIYGKQNFHKGAFGIIPKELDGYESSSDLPAFDFREKNEPKYIFYFLSQESVYTSAEAYTKGTGSKRLHEKTFLKFSIPIPTLPEQQKIADFLSNLDEWIAAEEEKLTLLETYKKGLLQNLFPAQGETVPKLRFPEFKNSGAWQVKRLGEVAEILKGKGISKSDITEDGDIPCIRYGEIYTHYGEIIKSVYSFTSLPINNLVLSRKNDVIVPASGETHEDIAKGSCVKIEGVALGGDINIIRSSILEGDFLAYYISHGLRSIISKVAQGVSVIHLYPQQLKRILIKVPSKAEQQKIADCLSALDEQIEAQRQKVEQLREHKKGLLQQLFPMGND